LFIQDVNNTPTWLANVSSSEVIKQLSVTENIFTVKFSAIWPACVKTHCCLYKFQKRFIA
jgi:hypothetical protein